MSATMLEPRFWRLGTTWTMSVTLTFVFKWNGLRPDRFASGRLAGKKQREFRLGSPANNSADTEGAPRPALRHITN
jgi:hypothetical protein